MGSHVQQTCWLSELDILGALPSGESLKCWGTRLFSPNLCLRVKLRFLKFLLIVCCCVGWGLWWECFSSFLPICFVYFLVCLMCSCHPTSFFISEGIALCVAVDSVCLWEVSLRASYVATLDQNSLNLWFYSFEVWKIFSHEYFKIKFLLILSLAFNYRYIRLLTMFIFLSVLFWSLYCYPSSLIFSFAMTNLWVALGGLCYFIEAGWGYQDSSICVY